MRLRSIVESSIVGPGESQPAAPAPNQIVVPDSILQRLGGWSAGTVIDSGAMDKTWPFFFTAELGLSMGKQDTYHADMTGEERTARERLFSNIYRGGEMDPDTYRVDRDAAKPGVAGRVGYGLFMPAVRGGNKEFFPVFVVGFYDNDQLQWCGNAVEALVKERIVEADKTYVVPADESAQTALTLQEFMASRPVQPLPTIRTPAQPERKSWQGEMSKIQPGAKWWAPTSESKQKRQKLQ